MAKADQIKALIRSHAEGDDARFYAIAMQVAAQAARSGQGKFAQELRTLVDRAKEPAKSAATRQPGPIPMVQPRGELAGLLTVGYPKTGWPTWRSMTIWGAASIVFSWNSGSENAFTRTASPRSGNSSWLALPGRARP